MKRTVTESYELRGQRMKAGDRLVIFYASANRDEEVFDEPFLRASPSRSTLPSSWD